MPSTLEDDPHASRARVRLGTVLQDKWTLDSRPRHRRDGRGVRGDASQRQARRRQDAPPRVQSRRGGPHALPPGGVRRQHDPARRRGQRPRRRPRAGRLGVHRHGAARRRDASSSAGSAAARGCPSRDVLCDRRSAPRRARRRARQERRPPRHQAREPLRHQERRGQGARLRDRQGLRAAAEPAVGDARGMVMGTPGLHGARAGARAAGTRSTAAPTSGRWARRCSCCSAGSTCTRRSRARSS